LDQAPVDQDLDDGSCSRLWRNCRAISPAFKGRSIILSDGQEGDARPTDRLVSGSWSGDFMSASYRIVYNDARQDGFLSDPRDGKDVDHLQFAWIDQPLLSSLRLDSRRVCLSAEEGFQVSDQSHEFTLGPLGTFGSMDRITGCACIVKNKLDRFHLLDYVPSSELTAYLASATVGIDTLLHIPLHELTITTKYWSYISARLPMVVSDVKRYPALSLPGFTMLFPHDGFQVLVRENAVRRPRGAGPEHEQGSEET